MSGRPYIAPPGPNAYISPPPSPAKRKIRAQTSPPDILGSTAPSAPRAISQTKKGNQANPVLRFKTQESASFREIHVNLFFCALFACAAEGLTLPCLPLPIFFRCPTFF